MHKEFISTPNVFLGIDLGTSGLRLVAINNQGQILAAAEQTFTPGQQENPHHWFACLDLAMHNLTTQLPLKQIRAILVDATSGSLLLTSEDFSHYSAVRMYYHQAQHHCTWQDLPAQHIAHSRQSAMANALDILQDFAPRPARLVHQVDWINYQLCGHWCSDWNSALKSGYDLDQRRWCHALGDEGIVKPNVLPTGQKIAQLSPGLVKKWGLHGQTWLLAGTTDSIAAYAAVEAQAHDLVVSLGTTLAFKAITNRPINDLSQGIYSHAYGEHYLLGGASNTGGAILAAHFSLEEMEAWNAQLMDAEDVEFYGAPLLRPGERFPITNPELMPQLPPEDWSRIKRYQALVYALVQWEKMAITALSHIRQQPFARIISLGGGQQNRYWMALRKKYLGYPLVESQGQSTAFGAALLAKQHFNP